MNKINITTDNIIIQGESKNTKLVFDINEDNHCFYVYGSIGSTVASVTQDIPFKSNNINFNNSALTLSAGDWIFYYDRGVDMHYPDNTNPDFIGQITQVVSRVNYYLTVSSKSAMTYDKDDSYVRKLNPIENVGFENFYIERTNTEESQYGNTIYFLYAVNSWVTGIESYNCTGSHIRLQKSAHNKVSGNYLHHASNYDSFDGSGYGMIVSHGSTNNLIENNIFRKTRHAMLLSTGANSNVFTFNYSREPEWDFFKDGSGWKSLPWVTQWLGNIFGDVPGQIEMHGQYPFSNLFEGNIIPTIMSDGTHGLNGPYNTYFRNNAYNQAHMELYSMHWANAFGNNIGVITADNHVVVTPELFSSTWKNLHNDEYWVASSNVRDVYLSAGYERSHAYWGYNRISSGNRETVYSKAYFHLISEYYASKPSFIDASYSWPATGPHTSLGSYASCPISQDIPAKDRYWDTEKTYLDHETVRPVSAPNITIASGEMESIRLTWTDENVNCTYKVYRSVNNGSYILEGTTSSKSFTDTDYFLIPFPNISLKYKVKAEDNYGNSLYSNILQTANAMQKRSHDLVEANIEYKLSAAYPNPFNPSTSISFDIAEEGEVILTVYDMMGKEIKSLYSKHTIPGSYSVMWDGSNDHNQQVANGVYFYRLDALGFSDIKRMVYFK